MGIMQVGDGGTHPCSHICSNLLPLHLNTWFLLTVTHSGEVDFGPQATFDRNVSRNHDFSLPPFNIYFSLSPLILPPATRLITSRLMCDAMLKDCDRYLVDFSHLFKLLLSPHRWLPPFKRRGCSGLRTTWVGAVVPAVPSNDPP